MNVTSEEAGARLHGLFCIALAALFFTAPLCAQLPNAPETKGPRDGYVGDLTCRTCHEQVFNSFLATAHHLTSRLPDRTSIDGKFTPGANILHTANPNFYFVMQAIGTRFFQRAVAILPPSEAITRQEPFDIVIGSGRKGQTYLYWRGGELFELPVSYWSESQKWMNSPGYSDGLPNFDKPIVARCLECHGTYILAMPPPPNHFDRTSFLPGIACETCHGPGAIHVANRQSGDKEFESIKDIINPASLSRERQMDLCALCHAGPGTPKEPSFSYAPGSVLNSYLTLSADVDDTPPDVHAHQVQLLQKSRCFRSSSMTCSTCHDVHKTQRDVASFSERCLSCHQATSCGQYAVLGSQILRKCVDCHMPLKRSNVIVFDAGSDRLQPQVRTHRIAIY